MAPVAVPLAVPLAPAVGAGLAAGVGAALRWGPLLLQLLERGGQPVDFRRTPVNSPGRSRQLEQLQALIEGARVGVAMPQPPPLPGGPGFGAVGSLLNAAALFRALQAAAGLLNFPWGPRNSRERLPEGGAQAVPYLPADAYDTFRPHQSDFEFQTSRHIGLRTTGPHLVPSGVVPFGGGVTIEAEPGHSAGGALVELKVQSIETGETGFVTYLQGGVANYPDNFVTYSFEWKWVFFNSGRPEDGEVQWQAEDGPLVAFVPGPTIPDDPAPPSVPVDLGTALVPLAADAMAGPAVALAPVPAIPPLADPGPLLQPLPVPGTLPVPSNPAPGQVGGTDPAAGTGAAGNVAPGGLAVAVPTVQPLPAYVPRPVPGPTLPEYVPETQPQPQRVTPTRPTIPGTTPRPAPARPGQPFPAVPAEPGIVPTPDPSTDPAFIPAPAPGPAPGPNPAPGVDPATTPGPAPGPGPGPGGVPVPGPPAVPTTPAGPVAVPIPRPVPTTPTDQHIPAPGDAPVTGNGPAPTLVAMAQEMGRQEQKLGRLLQRLGDPTRPSDPLAPLTDATDLAQLLLQLLELFQELDGPGQYAINSPCNTDPASGEQLPDLVASWGGSSGVLPGVVKRLDALAQLLQHQKDLPQPICRGPRPTGSLVTVNFEQVPDGLETST